MEAFVSILTGFETDAPCWQVVFLKTDSTAQAPSLFGSATCSVASKVAMIGGRKWKVMTGGFFMVSSGHILLVSDFITGLT